MNARIPALLFLLRRAAGLPPRALWRMAQRRIAFRLDSRAFNQPGTRFSSLHILARLDAGTLDEALRALTARALFPLSEAPDTHAADAVMAGDVEIFGTAYSIGAPPLEWRRDFKSGMEWPLAPAAQIRVNRPDEPCDIKIPWELSRLQWLFPLAQAWRRTRDDAYARRAREIIEDWDEQNPALQGPNWVSAMEASMRGTALVWLAGQCLDSHAWAAPEFRARLARMLWLHGRFISRNVEWADVNGNHVIACAMGLCVLGAALPGPDGRRWSDEGWNIIREELPAQTGADGVTFEASAAYHRFVLEMVLTALTVRRARGLSAPPEITGRIAAMAAFMRHCTRADGTMPAWGDDDSGRILPPDAFADALAEALADAGPPASKAFPDAGVYILRAGDSHIFMDAGPVGMNGRGGHGHNDCLHVDVTLCGAPLIIDPGTWTYTADAAARNRFRSSAAHNGPTADGEEINRFVHPHLLWMLRDDAKPLVKKFTPAPESEGGGGEITAAHTGYDRLRPFMRPERTVRLDGARHAVRITDNIVLGGPRALSIRYMLHPSVKCEDLGQGRIKLTAPEQVFILTWDGPGWSAEIEPARASPAYGVLKETSALVFRRAGRGPARLTAEIAPELLAKKAKKLSF